MCVTLQVLSMDKIQEIRNDTIRGANITAQTTPAPEIKFRSKAMIFQLFACCLVSNQQMDITTEPKRTKSRLHHYVNSFNVLTYLYVVKQF